jgi:hypothetical protein
MATMHEDYEKLKDIHKKLRIGGGVMVWGKYRRWRLKGQSGIYISHEQDKRVNSKDLD